LKKALVQWLREGGRGRHLENVRSDGEDASDVLHMALREGALPSLKGVQVDVAYPTSQVSLTGGLLEAMQKLRLVVTPLASQPQLAALALVKLVLVRGEIDQSVEWPPVIPIKQRPPFIPPSLKALSIEDDPVFGPLLHALPDMLGASLNASKLRHASSLGSLPPFSGLNGLSTSPRYAKGLPSLIVLDFEDRD
jgi:hypothetical protein